MQKSEKERVVAELTERLQNAETLIVADYRGLTVTQIGELRGKLYEHGARFSIVKNSLTKRAAESAGVQPLLALLEGPTAIAFLETDGDPVAVAKALDDADRAEILTLKGGLLEGAEIGADDIKQLAKLPPAETLRAQLVGAVAGPLTAVVGLFAAPMRELVGVIDARIRQLEERGEGGEPVAEAAPEEPPAEEPSAEEPAAEAAPEEEPAAEEPAAEAEPEQAEEEPAAADPAAEEQAPEEPKAEAAEPATEEPATEEPAAEEPAAEEPAAEETQEGEQE